jgi:hypothetical protein
MTTDAVVKTGPVGIGGMMALPSHAAGAPPRWGTYVTVDDVEATARPARALGAKTIVPLTDIPNVGRFSPFQDPHGAVLSIMTTRSRAPQGHTCAGHGGPVPRRADERRGHGAPPWGCSCIGAEEPTSAQRRTAPRRAVIAWEEAYGMGRLIEACRVHTKRQAGSYARRRSLRPTSITARVRA